MFPEQTHAHTHTLTGTHESGASRSHCIFVVNICPSGTNVYSWYLDNQFDFSSCAIKHEWSASAKAETTPSRTSTRPWPGPLNSCIPSVNQLVPVGVFSHFVPTDSQIWTIVGGTIVGSKMTPFGDSSRETQGKKENASYSVSLYPPHKSRNLPVLSLSRARARPRWVRVNASMCTHLGK